MDKELSNYPIGIDLLPTDYVLSLEDAKILLDVLSAYTFWPDEKGLKARNVMRNISKFVDEAEGKNA